MFKNWRLKLTPHAKELEVHVDANKAVVRVPRQSPTERFVGATGVDSFGSTTVLHFAEAGNVTGMAVVMAVKGAENSGLKGPRLLVDPSLGLLPANQTYLMNISGSPLKDVVWNVDFAEPERSMQYLFAVLNLIRQSRFEPSVAIHYWAAIAICVRGVEISFGQHPTNLIRELRDFIQTVRHLFSIWDLADGKSTDASMIWSTMAPAVSVLLERGITNDELRPCAGAGEGCPDSLEKWNAIVQKCLQPQVKMP